MRIKFGNFEFEIGSVELIYILIVIIIIAMLKG